MAEEGLQQSGIILVAKGYQQYLKQLQTINKAQKAAFSGKGQAQFRQEVKKTTKATKDAAKGTSAWRQGLKMLTSGDILGGLRMLRKAIFSIKMLIPELLALVGLAKVITTFTQFFKVSGDVAQRNETLMVSLEQVGTTAGYTAEQIKIAEAAVKAKGITTQAARQSLIQMAQAEIEWADAAELARVAQEAAVIGGINSSEAFQRMIVGIQRGETEILKTIGLNVSFEQAYVRLSKQLGINRKALTEQQKAQARADAVLAAGTKIAGTYEAALETSGKQQSSLARHIEETQAAAGKLMLPFRELAIQSKTMKWKGLKDVMKGLASFEPVLRIIIQSVQEWYGWQFKLVKQLLGIKEGVSIFYALGEALHKSARAWAILGTIARTVIQTISENFSKLFLNIAKGFQAIVNRDFKGLAQAAIGLGRDLKDGLGEDLTKNLRTNFQKLLADFPDLFKDFDELGDVATGSLERPVNAAQRLAAELAEVKKQLELQMTVLQKFESIQDQYQKGLASAANRYNEQIDKAEEGLTKGIQKAQQKASKAMLKLTDDAAEKRTKIEMEHGETRRKRIVEHFRDLEQERRRFELSRMQNMRRFQLQERRLMAEGDVLGLQQLREDEDLRRKEEDEDNQLSRTTAQDQLKFELRNLKEGMGKKLKDLDEDIAKRRANVQESYQEDLNDLVQANQERKAEALASYQDQLEKLKVARSEQLQALGKSYNEQGEITEEAMSEIAQKVADLYGDQGVYDAIMTGWEERTRGAMSGLYEDTMAQLEDIASQLAFIEATGEVPEGMGATRDGTDRGRRRGRTSRRRGMRQGGVGVVTGPALFEVEPGVREIVAFAPIPQNTGHGRLDVGVSGNIGFPDAAASGASPAIVEAAVEQTLAEIGSAVKRLNKR